MATHAIDQSDDFRPVADPSENAGMKPGRARRSFGTLAIGLGVVAGMAGLAEAWTGAVSDAYGSFRADRGAIKMGRIADMPEIKDGVVALAPSGAPVRVIPGAPIAPTPQAAPVQAAATAAPVQTAMARPVEMKPTIAARPAPAVAAIQTPAPARPAPVARSAEARPTVTGSTSPAAPVAAQAELRPVARPTVMASAAPAPLPPAAPRIAAAPVPAQTPTPRVAATPVPSAAQPAAPLPPTRAAQRKVEPRAAEPQRVARVANAAPEAAPAVAEAAAQDRSLLGIPVPGFVPSGNDLKSGFDSISDAITSLPKRL